MLLTALAITLTVGLAAKLGLDFLSRNGSEESRNLGTISWLELAIGALLVGLILVPATLWAGNKIAVNNQLSGFKEYWNGYETGTTWQKQGCSRDGSCIHEYNCDPYQQMHTRVVTDSNGNTSTETYYTTEYHDCPYVDEEWTFKVQTTLGEYTIAAGNFPTDPYDHVWRDGHGLPGHLVDSAGIPEFWNLADIRINSGRPGPVTEVNTYENYILASQDTILNEYSAEITEYKEAGLLPKPAHGTTSYYLADKVYDVGGVSLVDPDAWEDALMRFNAALGSERQGDLHLLMVDAGDVDSGSSDDWFGALRGYWQSPELGKDSVSKNSLIVAIGTDGKTVEWAEAATGMPVGNGELLASIRNDLIGAYLEPQAILGPPDLRLDGEEPSAVHGDALLDKLVFGEPGFVRVCMSKCEDDGEEAGLGYNYLKDEIKPTGTQKFWIIFVATVLAGFLWFGLVVMDNRITSPLAERLRSIWDRTGGGPDATSEGRP